MELNRIGSYVAVAVIAAIAAVAVDRTVGQTADGGKCDIHPRLTDSDLSKVRTNLARMRSQVFDTALAEGNSRDSANKTAEDAAFDTFVHNLRGALAAEYRRHRESLDGCF